MVGKEGANKLALDERVYANSGNQPLIDMLENCGRVLDVGCGNGANARLLKKGYPSADISGVTCSVEEAAAAAAGGILDTCWVFDIETAFPESLGDSSFDTLIFSHVLEHLREPATALKGFVNLLPSGGQVLIAVPNVLFWRMRIKFLLGKFEYESAGILDDTHLRFFTYFTAGQYLLERCSGVTVAQKCVSGSVPLWWLRRYVLPKRWSKAIDDLGCKYFPNLFGAQILIKAIKK